MNWKYIKPLKNENAIKEFEETYNFVFPDSFKEIVKKNNGARPEMDIYDTNLTKERTIKSLLSFNKDDKESIWKIAEWNKGELNEKFIAFAIDHFGNLICFHINDGTIIFVDMENLKTEIIADDFSCFLNKLYIMD